MNPVQAGQNDFFILSTKTLHVNLILNEIKEESRFTVINTKKTTLFMNKTPPPTPSRKALQKNLTNL